MTTASYAKKVNVRGSYNQEHRIFALTCDDLPGLYLAGPDLNALHQDVPNVIKMLFKLDCGMDVTVTPLTEPEHEPLRAPVARGFVPLGREFVALPARAA